MSKKTKEVVISTGSVNCYGSRVLTDGIDITQYEKNPVLLYMHKRCFDGSLPIGRITNLRKDGDRLIGTPEFDDGDEKAAAIASKWENGFLRMASAGLEIIAVSDAKEDLMPGQTRPTITKSKLIEVSIVDIGANDDALQLYSQEGNMLKLAGGADCDVLPLLKKENENAEINTLAMSNNKQEKMKELLLKLGLAENATEQDAIRVIEGLQKKVAEADKLALANIESTVDKAIAEHRISADKRDMFVTMGKQTGIANLASTLELIPAARKPTSVIEEKSDAVEGKKAEYAKLSEVPENELAELKEKKPTEYAKLYKAEYGIELPAE